ncbi:uncharacterized protein LOC124859033 isoform X2 [Girardinichthys multiradiatus]|uniref:uncharacterized protein LOC124859033 isoform X2 n=1 Tax=Girardinichthys multiradiatus TaxID=208333 RepID=UPI001FAC9C98|nr:uncharacterized protein LOC124859033 isoform X2 [Girardinichthys multiradiatus]
MDKFAHIIGDKVGDMVEGAVKNALGVEDKKKDKKKGGGLSIFGGGKGEKKEEKGGIFSFGHDDKKKNKEEDKGFFTKIIDKADDKDKGMQKKTGFQGLFAEGEGGAAMGGEEGVEAGGNPGQTVAVSDRDLFDDLLDVAEETTNN